MSDADRRLCLDYLVFIGATRGQAKQNYAILTHEGRRSLLVEAKSWADRGRAPISPCGTDLPPADNAPVSLLSPKSATKAAPAPLKPSARPKKVMFSILLPPADLEALRALSEQTGETMAYHVRSAIRRYLKASGEV